MATYSVYRYGSPGFYDYFEGPDRAETHAGAAPIRAHASVGATPEQAAWKVPLGAKKIGSGEMPMGKIAVLSSSLSGLGDTSGITAGQVAVTGVVAYLLWRHFR